MMNDVEYRDRLPPRIRFGCAILEHADQLDLAEASLVDRDGGVAIMLLHAPKHPDGEAFIAVRMYRLPRRRVRFEEAVEWFCKSKKDRCRLPDRTDVTDATLALVDLPVGWSHDARPQSGRSLLHVYRSKRSALILQIAMRPGVGPDHPLLQAVRENLHIDSNQWIAKRPSVRRIAVPGTAAAIPPKQGKKPVTKPRRTRPPAPKAVTKDPAQLGRGGTRVRSPGPSQVGWPRGHSIRDWLLALLNVADGIVDDQESTGFAIAAIEKLGRIEDGRAAVPFVDEYLRRIPPSSVSQVLRLATVGADVCFRAGDRTGMEKYLAVASATEPYNKRKVDVGYSLNTVRHFRAWRGILDPAEATDDDERRLAEFKRAGRLFRQAVANGDANGARALVEAMSSHGRGERKEWRRHDYLCEVIAAWAYLDDVAEIRRHLKMIDPSDRHKAIDMSVLVRLGMLPEMLPRLRAALRENLDAVADVRNLNSHHDIGLFVRNLRRLEEAGARDEARRWLHRAVKVFTNRPPTAIGAFSSAVPGLLAEAATLLGEVVLARQLLGIAKGEAKQERHPDWRRGSVEKWLLSSANVGMVEAAIDEARRVRPIRKRRQKLAALFAKFELWDRLHQLLDEIESAAEVVEAVWWLHHELPGAGAV